jgi:transcriptional regulator with XRE-family HTH domain
MSALTLKRAREDAGLTAAELASRTRLSPRIVAAIEAERYDLLPAGLYARTAVRAYAQAVGIEPDTAIAELRSKLPEAPLDLAEVAELRAPTPRPGRHHYALAAALDAAILLSIDAVIVRVCATGSGLLPFELLATAPGSMAILCAAPIVFYFWLLGATDVRTAGPWLFDLEILPPFEGPLSFEEWWRRGFVYVAREMKLASGVIERSGGALVCEHHR